MSTNWKSFLETTQAKTYVLPKGWDTKEKVAEMLGCSDERVRLLLSPAIKSGEVEMKVFPVFDKVTHTVRRVTAYRKLSPDELSK